MIQLEHLNTEYFVKIHELLTEETTSNHSEAPAGSHAAKPPFLLCIHRNMLRSLVVTQCGCHN